MLPDGYEPSGDTLHSHPDDETNYYSSNESHFSDDDFTSGYAQQGGTLHVTTPDKSHESFSADTSSVDFNDFRPGESTIRYTERTGNFTKHR